MRARIGPYRNLDPRDLLYRVFGSPEAPTAEPGGWRWRMYRRVSDTVCGPTHSPTWVTRLFSQLRVKLGARSVYVWVDDYDVWNMDMTLKHIIHPMLVKLRDKKHGSGFIDDQDVPEGLRSTAPGARDGLETWDVDHNFHSRYQWFLGEVIWAFDPDNTDFEYYEGMPEWEIVDQRRDNAYRLFGKYYQTLWT